MMIAWLVRQREAAAFNWRENVKLLHSVDSHSRPAVAFYVRKYRRRLRLWDALLDAATWRERRSPDSGRKADRAD